MRRRDILKVSVGAAMLAAPRVVLAERERTLKFVPTPDLTQIDPVYSGTRPTHNHAYLVFDTLYGLDETLTVQPQMLQGHTVDNGGTLWTLRLREGLRFHDGTPVLARDAVASIRRFAARDTFGQSLMAVTTELSAPNDRTLRFRLTKPFPHLPAALAGSTLTMPCIMPERLANIDPFRQVTEMVGSGPYRFITTEFDAGVRAAYRAVRRICAARGGSSKLHRWSQGDAFRPRRMAIDRRFCYVGRSTAAQRGGLAGFTECRPIAAAHTQCRRDGGGNGTFRVDPDYALQPTASSA